MNNRHLNVDELTRYFLNNLTRDNETVVQEHLSSCAKCQKNLDNIRLLKKSIFETDNSLLSKTSQNKPFFKIFSSNWTRFAAAAVVVIGVGLGYYSSIDNGSTPVNEGIVPETVFSLDSLSKEDSLEYYCPEDKADPRDL